MENDKKKEFNLGLRKIDIKKSYDSDTDDILNDFYIPALKEAKIYKRLAGFFSSSTLAIAAKGIQPFIEKGGKMELVCGCLLSKEDVLSIEGAYKDPAKVIEESAILELNDIQDEFIRDHVSALGWMIARGNLEIKIAVVKSEKDSQFSLSNEIRSGIFHQKVGILEDEYGNAISFSGSDNESASAWTQHIEEFKVFRNWVGSESDYFTTDLNKFEKFWQSKAIRTYVIDFPQAIKEKIISFAPSNFNDLKLPKWDSTWTNKEEQKTQSLWKHQKEAVDAWFANDCRGIFEMATGSGKTIAALECIRSLSQKKKRLLCIIATPYNHLTTQWVKSYRDFGLSWPYMIADSSNRSWKNDFADIILDLNNNTINYSVVFTTHDTLSSEDFMKIVQGLSNIDTFLIADEVHGMGAPVRKKALIELYNHRLGLSATPKRWFDDIGTDSIYQFFGNPIYEFSLHDAIMTINEITKLTFLVPYQYKPIFVELTDDEMQEYIEITERITRNYFASKNNIEREGYIELLYFERAGILNNASGKFEILHNLIKELLPLDHCLIYCSPKQLSEVQDILNSLNIIQHKFTMDEKVKPEKRYGGKSERDNLIRKFSEGSYEVLVAIKCLDEGVDIPSAKTAILMASSGNPREFIQRRGRVLRRAPNKNEAIIFDLIVLPPHDNTEIFDRSLEKKILKKEFDRFIEFAVDARNSMECLKQLNDIRQRYLA